MQTDCPDTTAPDSLGSVYLAYASSLFDYLGTKGHDVAALLAGAGLRPAQLQDKEHAIPTMLYLQLWQRAVELTDDPYLGLHVGEVIRPGKYGVLGYAMMSCETLGEALLRQQRYQNLIGKTGRAELVERGEECELGWYAAMARHSRHVGEEHVASWVAFARWMINVPGDPLRILFEHQAPADLSEHRRIFNCALEFDQTHTAVVFPAHFLALPLKNTDPAMQRLMDSHAESLLARRTQSDSDPTADIRNSIERALPTGVPAIETIAAQLKLHPRTLQRRLFMAGLSFKGVVDDVRRSLALRYVNDPKLELIEIAFLLGFAEQSSFQRAFKRWTGKPPGQYRGRA
ncbi:MAG: AraC family transcriptional regulator [Nevskiales bacterium]